MSEDRIDPRILELCKHVTAKRPRTVIEHILRHGRVTTEELQSLYGYDHPPRAARDVRENGVPLETFKVKSERTGRMIGAYRFADPAKIKRGRIGGRRAFSKRFREALLAKYGSADAITGEKIDSRYLQIDHRIPYEVAGDESYDEDSLEEFMLLDASSQRAKSWSCEQCVNWRELLDKAICRECFWAFPKSYTHIATEPIRRTEVEWRGPAEVMLYEELRAEAQRRQQSIGSLIKDFIRSALSKG